MALQFNGTSDTNVRAGVYEVTEEQNEESKDVGGDHEEVVRKISFAEILQQVTEMYKRDSSGLMRIQTG